MASFSSGGKRPSQPPVIYAPPPPPAYMPDDSASDGASDAPAASPETIQREREQNLLRRARSSLGTVLNGFRGILAPNDNAASQRKSLLGE